ncbi:MAG: transcription elongation factor GreB [Polyangiaceae bacterium]|nr:transcription elongation factor GreB [Polyangiaceae bacterium]
MNHITPEGAKALQEELQKLWRDDRPKIVRDVADAAAMGDRSENAEYIYGKKKLREIDRRIQFLRKRLEIAVVVNETVEDGTVRFGAWIDLEDEDGAKFSYRLVGEDETDAAKNYISWKSPLGSAALKKKVGQTFLVRRPRGEMEFTILAVRK